MTRLDQIEASMAEAKAWAAQGTEYRERALHKSGEQMAKLALLLAEMTEDLEAIEQVRRIVEDFKSI